MSVVGGVWLRTEQMHEKDRVLRWTGTKNVVGLCDFRKFVSINLIFTFYSGIVPYFQQERTWSLLAC